MSVSTNEQSRINWVAQELKKIPEGLTILDAGAGEQQYKKYCSHLNYVSQDFAAYSPNSDQHGLQMGAWDYGKLDIVSDFYQTFSEFLELSNDKMPKLDIH
jgi:hypothetical protein